MSESLIPIIVGVTGHRDIQEQAKPKLRIAVLKRLLELKRLYPHSPFILITGLAEGADQLVAEAALEAKYEVSGVLPMPKTLYEEDFNTPELLDQFNRFVLKTNQLFVCPYYDSTNLSRNQAYLALGRYIAEHSQIVIALWDGINEQLGDDGKINVLTGGTADVVRMCREGFENEPSLQLRQADLACVNHLWVQRKKHTKDEKVLEHKAATWAESANQQETKSNERIYRMLKAIDQFNEFCKEDLPKGSVHLCREWLLSSRVPAIIPTMLKLPIEAFSLADAAAVKRQQERNKIVKYVSLLTILSILCQQIYSGPDMRWGWLFAHIGLAVLAFCGFFYFFRGRHRREEQYLDWRSLAEGLRVQIFWQAAGLRESIADHYLISDKDELDWIRQAIRNTTIGVNPLKESFASTWVREAWLLSQNNYYKKKNPENATKSDLYNRITQGFFFSALILTAITLVMHLLAFPDFVLNGLILASGMGFVLAAVFKTYAEQMAYEEQRNRYSVMAELFGRALSQYDELINKGDFEGAKRILLMIGKEALAENASWLRLHRQRQFEINL